MNKEKEEYWVLKHVTGRYYVAYGGVRTQFSSFGAAKNVRKAGLDKKDWKIVHVNNPNPMIKRLEQECCESNLALCAALKNARAMLKLAQETIEEIESLQ